jgi:hypothetical protein
MKSKVGLNILNNGRLVFLVTTILILTLFNGFGISIEDEMDLMDINLENNGLTDETPPKIVRSSLVPLVRFPPQYR